jgi:hypothetical protein
MEQITVKIGDYALVLVPVEGTSFEQPCGIVFVHEDADPFVDQGYRDFQQLKYNIESYKSIFRGSAEDCFEMSKRFVGAWQGFHSEVVLLALETKLAKQKLTELLNIACQ